MNPRTPTDRLTRDEAAAVIASAQKIGSAATLAALGIRAPHVLLKAMLCEPVHSLTAQVIRSHLADLGAS